MRRMVFPMAEKAPGRKGGIFPPGFEKWVASRLIRDDKQAERDSLTNATQAAVDCECSGGAVAAVGKGTRRQGLPLQKKPPTKDMGGGGGVTD